MLDKSKEVATPMQLTLEAKGVALVTEAVEAASPCQPTPEAYGAASSAHLTLETNKAPSTVEFMPEADREASKDSCQNSPKEVILVHCTGGYAMLGGSPWNHGYLILPGFPGPPQSRNACGRSHALKRRFCDGCAEYDNGLRCPSATAFHLITTLTSHDCLDYFGLMSVKVMVVGHALLSNCCQ